MERRSSSRIVLSLVCLLLALFYLGPMTQFAAAQAVDLRQGVRDLAAQLGERVPERQVLKVAVADFPDLQGTISDLGRFVAERLTTELSLLPETFQVIERRRLVSVVEELKLNMSALVEPDQVRQLGQMLGVDALVTGSLSDLGTVVDVDARLIIVETFIVLPGASVGLSKDQVVADMLQRGRQAAFPDVLERQAPAETVEAAVAESSNRSLRLQALGAQGNDNEVRVMLLLTNLTPEATRVHFKISDPQRPNWDTYLVDNLGSRYPAIGGNIGGNVAAGPGWVRLDLVPNLPIRVELVFEPLSAGAESVTLVLPRSYGFRSAMSLGPMSIQRNQR